MKKMQFIFGICLLFALGLNQAAAQATSSWNSGAYWSPVVCDGEMVDYLEGGEIIVHAVNHSNWMESGVYDNVQIKGWVKSGVSEEIFTVKENGRTYFEDGHWVYKWTANLKGNMGNHYLLQITYSYLTGEVTFGKAVCL